MGGTSERASEATTAPVLGVVNPDATPDKPRSSGRYRAVVFMGPLDNALPGFDAPVPVRRALALGFAHDTLRAAVRSRQVHGVLVATPDRVVAAAATDLGATVALAPSAGDLRALAASARATLSGPELRKPTAVLSGTLPCLLPAELDQALRSSVRGRIEVLDLAGIRPTLRASTAGWPSRGALTPREPALRAAWLAGRELLPGLSCSVASLDGLRVAAYLGVGPATRAVLEDLTLPGVSWRFA